MKKLATAPQPQFWLVTESANNWDRDESRKFNHYGLTNWASISAQRMRKNDILFVYIPAPFKAMGGVRRVRSDELQRLDGGGDYDIVCPTCVLTEPLATLPKASWVKMTSLVPRLTFTRSHIRWGVGMRRTVRRLEREDARLILQAFVAKAAPSEQKKLAKLMI